MRTIAAVLFSIMIPSLTMGQSSEVSVSGGMSTAHNTGLGAVSFGGSVAGQYSPGAWDFGGGLSYRTLPKIGTPGGHQSGRWVYVRRWLGPTLFIGADTAQSKADVTVWTKSVQFVGATAGVRIRQRGNSPRRGDLVMSVSYDREIRTDAVAPNRTRSWTAAVRNDAHLSGATFFRTEVSYSHIRFLQNGDWWTGHSVRLGCGIAWRGRE